MEFRHLRYFVAVAEELSFTRAAERLHIAQPPLSIQIRALEAELGTVLLERSKRRVRLTAAGRTFLERARQLLDDAQRAGEETRRAAEGVRGRLRVAFTSSLPYSPVFSDVIRAYREARPDVDLQLAEMFTDEQFEALRRETLDLGLVRSPATDAPEDIHVRQIGEDRVSIVMPADHPLAAQTEVSMASLRDELFVTFPAHGGTGLPRLLTKLARAAGFEARVTQIAREATTQIALVSAGVGLALLPSPLEHVRLPRVCYRPVSDPEACFPLSVATRAGQDDPVVGGFLAVLDRVVSARRSGSRESR